MGVDSNYCTAVQVIKQSCQRHGEPPTFRRSIEKLFNQQKSDVEAGLIAPDTIPSKKYKANCIPPSGMIATRTNESWSYQIFPTPLKQEKWKFIVVVKVCSSEWNKMQSSISPTTAGVTKLLLESTGVS